MPPRMAWKCLHFTIVWVSLVWIFSTLLIYGELLKIILVRCTYELYGVCDAITSEGRSLSFLKHSVPFVYAGSLLLSLEMTIDVLSVVPRKSAL